MQNIFLFGWITLASFTPLNPPHPSRLTSEKTFSILRNSVNSITTELAISRTPKREVLQWALRKHADQEDEAVGTTAVAKEINVDAATSRFYLICFLNKQIEFKNTPKSFLV